MDSRALTVPAFEDLATGGHDRRSCTVVRMYRDECRVSGEGTAWFVEAPSAFGDWFAYAETESRDAAFVAVGEYMCESRNRQMHGQAPFTASSSPR
jgi:hypothetical protein